MRKELTPVFTREFASEKIGRIFSAKSMSKADALGTGPAVKVRIGNKIGEGVDKLMTSRHLCAIRLHERKTAMP